MDIRKPREVSTGLLGGIGYPVNRELMDWEWNGPLEALAHWTKCDSGTCYFISVFCERGPRLGVGAVTRDRPLQLSAPEGLHRASHIANTSIVLIYSAAPLEFTIKTGSEIFSRILD
ncbi:hypothetical protein EVAR_31318_1 [Eumeta japonica]|uniref:Uncharacterized protein n=1 Tax=Eumeta variegata TaxID=151549 RepID=A0A4C1XXK7_EUMVA|nr:hypothetical protein EVAR_31318_1 [Eumeta japonica]